MNALVIVERKGYGSPATLLINCYGEGCSVLIWATNEMNSRGVLQKKERIPFSCTRMATQSMKAEEKLIGFISLTLIYKILNKDSGSSLITCSIITFGKKKLSWLCAIGSEKQEVPWQVCLSSPSAVLFCALGCSPCHSSPCSFNMMDLFGKPFRWWEDRKRRKLTLDHKGYWPLSHPPLFLLPTLLDHHHYL